MKKKIEEPVFHTTTFWDSPSIDYGNIDHGDKTFVGYTPAFIIWNLLSRYTTKGDVVVDPMCGSGTTFDVAREMMRRVIAY